MNSSQMELKVQNVEYLQTIKEKAIDRITIEMVTDMLDEQIVADLTEIINENPGSTKLFFQRHSLIDFIEHHEMLSYKIN